MRKISTAVIRNAIADLAIEANIILRKDVKLALEKARKAEKKSAPKKILSILLENAAIARRRNIPICQDTGMAVVFCEIGDKVFIKGDINRAIDKGIRLGYKKGFLRKSVVADPLLRKNTKTNTPAVIHYSFIKGKNIRLTVLPKGVGSENASRVVMLRPTADENEIIDFVLKAVKELGPDTCPPLILGIGIGGTLNEAALLAKQATLKPVGTHNPKKHIARLEQKILSEINKTGIGPAAVGGKTTCLGVNILTFPTHIGSLPVCVNISCHALRSATRII
jgi:fumarate hydratase subunit alpha